MASADEENICRYCFEGDSVAKLISPCDCKGSSEFIHKRCVTKWMFLSESTTCELCHAEFRCRPSRWKTFARSLQRTKQEAICYAVIFLIFMVPVILFKSVADGLRDAGIMSYEQSDRLLTGGLFGTYLLLIIFGVLFVAVWVHKCHDDPEADAEVAPITEEDAALSSDDTTTTTTTTTDDNAASTEQTGACEERDSTTDAPAEASEASASQSTSGEEVEVVAQRGQRVDVIVHVPCSPAGDAASCTGKSDLNSDGGAASSTSPVANTTAATPSSSASSSSRTVSTQMTHGATPAHSLAAFLFHHRRNSNNSNNSRNSPSAAANQPSTPRSSANQRSTPRSSAAVSTAPSQSRDSRSRSPHTPFEVNVVRDSPFAHHPPFMGFF